MSNNKRIVIAIDGPAGAGKTTLAKRIAEKLGFVLINSGAMYRAVALWALRLQVALNDMHRLEQLAKAADIRLEPGEGRVLLNGEDVTEAIHERQISEAASKVSAVPGVRRTLELEETGREANFSTVAGELQKRDERDRKRTEAPLVQAPDAELVDTTGLTLDEVEDAVLRIVRARTSNGKAAAGC